MPRRAFSRTPSARRRRHRVVCHDVTQERFPPAPADVLFCRFLLTHLHDPGTALRAWAAAARPGARLLVARNGLARADDPTIARYYELVAALQSGYGQSLEVGAELDARVRSRGWRILSSRLLCCNSQRPSWRNCMPRTFAPGAATAWCKILRSRRGRQCPGGPGLHRLGRTAGPSGEQRPPPVGGRGRVGEFRGSPPACVTLLPTSTSLPPERMHGWVVSRLAPRQA